MSRAGVTGYRFDDYELNLVRGCFLVRGLERPLRSQSFRVLLYLLERPGELVTKDEIVAEIWHSVSVTDNALVQCIAEIRRALNDDSRHPRFVRTVPKVGYRFEAKVEPLSAAHSEKAAALVTSTSSLPQTQILTTAGTPSDTGTSLPVGWWQHVSAMPGARIAALTSVLLLGAVACGFWVFHRQVAPEDVSANESYNRPTIAIMYFENWTKDQSLNWLSEGLTDMMIADLAPSEETNILSREQLHYLFPSSSVRYETSEASVRNIAQRAHASTVVTGRFSGNANGLLLEVLAYDGKTGKMRAREQAAVRDTQEIVMQANLLSVRLASDLALRSAAQHSLADVMTTNVEAYRYYSLGVEKAQAYQNAQAIELLKKAIEFDPYFAMAFARIGYAYAVTDFVPAEGRPYLEKATRLSNSLSPKDRLYVSAWNSIAKGEYRAAISTLNQVIENYPAESEAYCQLGRLLRSQEKTDEAIRILQRGLEINPNAAGLYNALGVVLLGKRQYREAVEAEKHYVWLAPNDPNAHDSLGMVYEQSGDYMAAVSEYGVALTLDPEFEPSIVHMGDVWFKQGRYRDAIREYERYIQVTHSDAARAIGYGDLATVYRATGNRVAAQRAANEEMKHDPTAVWDAIQIALDQGEMAKASSLEHRLLAGGLNRERGVQSDIRTQFYNQGYLALRRGDAHSAVMNFQIALQHLPATSGIDLHEDCLANTYLQLGMWHEAVWEYQRILQTNPNYPLAQYHLATAYAHMNDTAHAQEAYARFLQSWQCADANLLKMFKTSSHGMAQL
jgi:tetratricopeptide (TPR) repeat protein/DNA-binding winged helix-turn-helix (wHTH) protein